QGMRTTLVMNQEIAYAMRVEMRSLELCTHVNLYRRVRRIAGALRRPEQEVARELTDLVKRGLLRVIYEETALPANGRKLQLPDPAEKLRLENFELLNLLSRMEIEWD